jgi:hypothetical protein
MRTPAITEHSAPPAEGTGSAALWRDGDGILQVPSVSDLNVSRETLAVAEELAVGSELSGLEPSLLERLVCGVIAADRRHPGRQLPLPSRRPTGTADRSDLIHRAKSQGDRIRP